MVNNFRTCKYCGTIFQYMGNVFCPKCLREMDEKFSIVKNFLYENPGASVARISEDTGIDEKMILYFLREGRLEMITPDGTLVCEKCGAPITSGRLCNNCRSSLTSILDKALPAKPTAQKMEKNNMGRKVRDKLHVDVTKK